MKYKDNFGVEDGVYSLLIYFYKKTYTDDNIGVNYC